MLIVANLWRRLWLNSDLSAGRCCCHSSQPKGVYVDIAIGHVEVGSDVTQSRFVSLSLLSGARATVTRLLTVLYYRCGAAEATRPCLGKSVSAVVTR